MNESLRVRVLSILFLPIDVAFHLIFLLSAMDSGHVILLFESMRRHGCRLQTARRALSSFFYSRCYLNQFVAFDTKR